MTVNVRPHIGPPPTNLLNVQEIIKWARKMYDVLKVMREGRLECTTEVTLTAGAATTTLNDYRLSPQSNLSFLALTANAAAVQASIYVATRSNGSCIITHTNDANVDKTFSVAILG